MKKVGFRLDVVDGWPPYDTEFIWAEGDGNILTIKSFPFFVNGIAYNDKIRIIESDDDTIVKWEVAEQSGNSTVWIIIHDTSSDLLERLEVLGCGYEGAPLKVIYSVNVPPTVDKRMLDSILEEYESSGDVSVAFPAFRDDA